MAAYSAKQDFWPSADLKHKIHCTFVSRNELANDGYLQMLPNCQSGNWSWSSVGTDRNYYLYPQGPPRRPTGVAPNQPLLWISSKLICCPVLQKKWNQWRNGNCMISNPPKQWIFCTFCTTHKLNMQFMMPHSELKNMHMLNHNHSPYFRMSHPSFQWWRYQINCLAGRSETHQNHIIISI